MVTIGRLLLAVPSLAAIDRDGSTWGTVGLWFVLSMSDLVDGYLARREGTTRSGAFLDPIADKVVVLGGSSVSACPENYPDFDYLHVGELGDATDDLFARLKDNVTRPRHQIVLTTKFRRELSEFPIPAYELAQIDRYLLGSIQFSSGCPYQCEFCDIPALYGRVARYKTPE